MAIQFALPVGTVVLCDYAMGGFRPPEMVKKRPVIIMSPRLPHRDGLCAVVPLSGSAPGIDVPYVVRLEMSQPLPYPFPARVFWAKCDMLSTVAFERLDMFHTERDQTGRRKYLRPQLTADQLRDVHSGILRALGLAGEP